MDQALRDFPKQFSFTPIIDGGGESREEQPELDRILRGGGAHPGGIVVAGMGGSALAADLLRARYPELDLIVHRGYGLPELRDLDDRRIVVSSYSGNTEEALDAYDAARRDCSVPVVVTTGGELLARASRDDIPRIVLPNTGIQPRVAIGFSAIALTRIAFGEGRELDELRAFTVDSDVAARNGEHLAAILRDRVPLIYASDANAAIAYTWKITCNETGKIPAFMNVVPELNHNEMNGFDVIPSTKHLSEHFHCIFLTDDHDHPSVQRRMEVTAALYAQRGIPTTAVAVAGATRWQRIFSTILLGDWMAYALATMYGADPEQVPMIEEFKRRIA